MVKRDFLQKSDKPDFILIYSLCVYIYIYRSVCVFFLLLFIYLGQLFDRL